MGLCAIPCKYFAPSLTTCSHLHPRDPQPIHDMIPLFCTQSSYNSLTHFLLGASLALQLWRKMVAAILVREVVTPGPGGTVANHQRQVLDIRCPRVDPRISSCYDTVSIPGTLTSRCFHRRAHRRPMPA